MTVSWLLPSLVCEIESSRTSQREHGMGQPMSGERTEGNMTSSWKQKCQRVGAALVMVVLTACAFDQATPESDVESTADTTGELTLSLETKERVTGSWSGANASFAFEVARTPTSLSFRLTELDGPEKLSIVSHLSDRHLEVNGRRAAPNAQGNGLTFDGDDGLLAEIAAMPEVSELLELRRELRTAAVDENLVKLVPEPTFFGEPIGVGTLGVSVQALTSCERACESQFASSFPFVVIFAPWLIPSAVQIYTACLSSCQITVTPVSRSW